MCNCGYVLESPKRLSMVTDCRYYQNIQSADSCLLNLTENDYVEGQLRVRYGVLKTRLYATL